MLGCCPEICVPLDQTTIEKTEAPGKHTMEDPLSGEIVGTSMLYCFTLSSPYFQDWLFAAESEIERDKWMEVMQPRGGASDMKSPRDSDAEAAKKIATGEDAEQIPILKNKIREIENDNNDLKYFFYFLTRFVQETMPKFVLCDSNCIFWQWTFFLKNCIIKFTFSRNFLIVLRFVNT